MYDINQNNASANTKKLSCESATEELVALSRGELSPLKTEQVRSHLEGCPECREEALELELAVRSWSSFEELPLPAGLEEKTSQMLEDAGLKTEQDKPQENIPPLQHAKGILFRVHNSLTSRLTAAAALLIAVFFFGNSSNAEAVERVQRKILGRRISTKLIHFTERVLDKLKI